MPARRRRDGHHAKYLWLQRGGWTNVAVPVLATKRKHQPQTWGPDPAGRATNVPGPLFLCICPGVSGLESVSQTVSLTRRPAPDGCGGLPPRGQHLLDAALRRSIICSSLASRTRSPPFLLEPLHLNGRLDAVAERRKSAHESDLSPVRPASDRHGASRVPHVIRPASEPVVHRQVRYDDDQPARMRSGSIAGCLQTGRKSANVTAKHRPGGIIGLEKKTL